MGMYTELFLQVTLDRDTPDDVIWTLKYMTRQSQIKPVAYPFPEGRHDWMLRCSSFYLFPHAFSEVLGPEFEGDRNRLFVRCDLKNYEGEIEAFLDWLAPYVEEDYHYQGHYMYEEDSQPTRVYFRNKTWSTNDAV